MKFLLYILLFLLPLSLLSNTDNSLVITGDKNYAPYSYLDANDKPKGFLIDLWDEWAKVSGTKVKYELKDWSDSIQSIEDGSSDIHSGLYDTSSDIFNLTPIHHTIVSLFSKKNYNKPLINQTVGVLDPVFGIALKKEYPAITVIEYDNYGQLLADMNNGKLELFFDSNEPVFNATRKTNLDIAISFVSQISNVVHSLQQERGASCGYISSSGKSFESKLDKIRKNSDEKIKNLRDSFKEDENLLKNYFSSSDYESLELTFDGIADARGSVDKLEYDFSNTYSKYTQSIAFLLFKISDISDHFKCKELSDELYAYSTLLMYKESIGQKRAALSALFSKDKFSKNIYEYYLTSNTQEHIYLKSYLHNVGKARKEQYLETFNKAVVKEVARYEKLALKKLKGNKVYADSEAWFDIVTKKIDMIQNLEHNIYKNILAIVDETKLTNKNNLTSVDKYKTIPLKKEFFFLMKPMVQDENLAKKIEDGFRKIPKEKILEIERKWIDEKNIYNNKSIFSKEELLWIKNNGIVKAGGELDWAPFDFVDENGIYRGISKDYLELIGKKTGLKFEYKTGETWSELLNSFKNKKFDLLPAIYHSKEREEFTLFSEPYYDVKQYIFTKQKLAGSVKGLYDLKNKRVAIIKDYIYEDFIKKDFPDISIVSVNSLNDGVDSVLSNKADAYIDNYTVVEYFLRKELISGIYPVAVADFGEQKLHIGINPELNILKSIIDKTLKDISFDEKKEIINKWIRLINTNNRSYTNAKSKKVVNLSADEKKWLNKHSVIKFTGDPNWLPFEAVNKDGEYIGIVSEHIKLIESMLPVRFDFIQTSSWDESIELAKSGNVDMLSETIDSDMKSHLNFTNSYLSSPVVMIMGDENSYVDNLVQIADKKIAVINGYGYLSRIYKKYPMISYHKVDSIQDGLLAVSTGKVDALLCTLALGSYTISNMALNNVKIVGKTEFTTELGFGINKKLVPLVGIMNKAIKNISDEQHHQIVKKWSSVDIENDIDYSLIWKIIGIAIGIAFVLIYWNRQLKKRVDLKTFELKALLHNFDKNVIASKTDLNGRIIYASKAFSKISGYTNVELIGQSHNIMRHKDMSKDVFKELWKTIKSGKTWKGEIKNRRKDGSYYWTESIISPEYDTQNNIIGYSAIREDITSKKEVEELSKTLEDKVKERTLELSESKERFSSMVENIPGVIYRSLLDDHLTILYSSDDLEQLSGYPLSDFVENHVRSFKDIVYSDDIDVTSVSFQEQLKHSNKFVLVYRIVRADGEIRWVKDQGQVTNPEDGSTSWMDGAIFDITEQKMLEKEILTNQELMTFVSEYASFGFWHFNPQIGDLFVNNVFVEMLGYDADEVLMQGYEDKMFKPFKDGLAFWEQLLHPDDVERTGKIIAAHINGETELYKVDYRMRRADGTWMWSTAIGRIAEYDNEGKATRFNGVNIDISEAKEAQRKIELQQQQFESMVSNTPGVIYRTSEDWNIEFLSDYISNLTGYPREYFDTVDKFFALIHPDDNFLIDEEISKPKHEEESNALEYRIIHKDGSVRWVQNPRNIVIDESGKLWRDGTILDITDVKEAQEKIEENRLFLNTLLDSQEQIIITTDGVVLHSINETFKNFFNIKEMEEFTKEYDCICDTFDVNAPDGYLQKEMDGQKWIEYVLDNPLKTHKAQIIWDDKVNIFSVTAARLPIKDEHLLSAVFTNITLLESQRTALEELHEKISDSIDYASLIQHALIPNENIFSNFFQDYFTIWNPRDVVGGDIYLAEQISEDEVVLMVVDCTGHGVPGAFVTMLVKAVERQIMSSIDKTDGAVSPAKMLSTFNRSIKLLLQQESEESVSNAGFDAGILYYNKKDRVIRFAGAEIALYMMQDGTLDFIKGDRHSIGYKKSDVNFEFKDHDIEVKDGIQLYITTDGFIDQNGGEKGFPYGKKRFKNLVEENHTLSMKEQEELLLKDIKDYQGDNDTNDDITLVGFKI